MNGESWASLPTELEEWERAKAWLRAHQNDPPCGHLKTRKSGPPMVCTRPKGHLYFGWPHILTQAMWWTP